MKFLKSKLKSNRAETLLELVISIALFSITILMAVTMFTTANNVSKKKYDISQAVDKAVTDIISEENIQEEKEISIDFETSNGKVIEKKVYRIGTQGLYKFDLETIGE